VTYDAFLKELDAGQVHPAYLFYGKEDLLCETGVQHLTDKLLSPDERSLNLSIIYGRDAVGLTDALNTPPVFAAKRVIVVKQAQDLPEKHQAAVVRYIQNPPSDGCLILWTGELDKRTTFYKQLEKNIKLVECANLKGRELNNWIRSYIEGQGKKLDDGTLGRLAALAFPSLREAASELDRIILMVGEKKNISLSDLEEAGSSSFALERWKLTDALSAGKVENAIIIGQNLQFWGLHSTQIIGDLFRLFQRLWYIKRHIDKHQVEQARRTMKLLPFLFEKYVNIAPTLSLDNLETGLIRIYNADLNIKSGIHSDDVELNLLIVELGRLLTDRQGTH